MTDFFGREIEITHPDKVLFPGEGLTKGEIVDYHARIAETMLPHARGRFLAMERFPDGIGGSGFYQRNAERHEPDWIRIESVPTKEGENRVVVAEEAALLVHLAQQGCITPHCWPSRADRPLWPDRLVFDFDPPDDGGSDGFDPIRRGAKTVRSVLDEVGLASFPMTSGSRGLHVHVPLERRVDFDGAKAFALDVARLVAARRPDELTVEVRKAKRAGRVFVDYLRNERAQTSVAPYALRARPGAPVAAPLDWDEVDRGDLGPRSYTFRNLFQRLGALGGDPWADIEDAKGRLDGERREHLDALLADAGLD